MPTPHTAVAPIQASRLHGSVDDSLMLVDALEPEFYSRRGFKASADATVVANEIKQWLTNEGTAEAPCPTVPRAY